MPLVCAAAIAYSPLFYRPRRQWLAVSKSLTKSVPQSNAAASETEERLDQCGATMASAMATVRECVQAARLDSLLVLVADAERTFDDSNTPQLHIHAGDEIWGDGALAELGESTAMTRFACDAETADLLIEEVSAAGFDIAESRGDYRPAGDPDRGVVASFVEPIQRLAGDLPVVPVHINCRVDPVLRGHRAHEFGLALAKALSFSSKRIGIVASGGMSGDQRGYLAGRVDATLDQWVLRRLATGRSKDVAMMLDVQSQALRGNTAEIRLWVAAAAALEGCGATARTISYIPFHHAAVGAGVAVWEASSCR